jgi:hypothetical protein
MGIRMLLNECEARGDQAIYLAGIDDASPPVASAAEPKD